MLKVIRVIKGHKRSTYPSLIFYVFFLIEIEVISHLLEVIFCYWISWLQSMNNKLWVIIYDTFLIAGIHFAPGAVVIDKRYFRTWIWVQSNCSAIISIVMASKETVPITTVHVTIHRSSGSPSAMTISKRSTIMVSVEGRSSALVFWSVFHAHWITIFFLKIVFPKKNCHHTIVKCCPQVSQPIKREQILGWFYDHFVTLQ